MRKALNKSENDKGFTLIELLVVIIIIGILAAIAIPIFLSQRKKAVDASMKSDVRSIATQMETAFTDTQAYPADADVAVDADGNLTISPADSVRLSPNNVAHIFVNSVGDAFCVQVTNPNSTRTAPNGYVWMSNAGGLQSTAQTCPSADWGTTDLVDAVVVP
jgi:prepilin-type N-terminal cleavage/methylation domain-containing protein